jgi:hypothetical protein
MERRVKGIFVESNYSIQRGLERISEGADGHLQCGDEDSRELRSSTTLSHG